MAGAASTMRAILYGANKTFELKTVPVPTPTATQVRVRVHAASINPVDYKLPGFPILGWLLRGKGVGLDFSGVVDSCASSSFKVGDRVVGNCSGALADYVVAECAACAKLPNSVTFSDAASLPTVALTSLQALMDNGFQPGHKVLVFGASGGCGSIGVQLAKAAGAAHVTGVCSGANAEAVRALGCDVVADYTLGDAALQSLLATQAPYDMTYDTVTSPEDKDYEPMSRMVLKPGGMHVAINGRGSDWLRALLSSALGLNLHRRSHKLFLKRSDGAGLAQIMDWVAQGKVKPQVEQRYAFTLPDVEAAFTRLKGRRTKGKLVIDVVQA
jgi:NADPH:quinone reductase-like Zn-dependent oxidoreductase